MEIKRAVRVAERMKETLASFINLELRDPRVRGVVVSNIELSDDLKFAKVYFRLMDLDSMPERQAEATHGLSKASGIIRREITARLALRFAPYFRFIYDSGQDAQLRVETLLEELKYEKSQGK